MAKHSSQWVLLKYRLIAIAEIVSGVFLVFFFGVGGIGACTQSFRASLFIVCLCFGFGGVWLIYKGIKHKKVGKLFQSYAAHFSTDPTRSIDLLASSTGASVAQTKKNLELLIKRRYFMYAYIDYGRNCVVFTQEELLPANQPEQKEEPCVMVTCHGCGATNKIQKDTVGECEFCGSKISEKG